VFSTRSPDRVPVKFIIRVHDSVPVAVFQIVLVTKRPAWQLPAAAPAPVLAAAAVPAAHVMARTLAIARMLLVVAAVMRGVLGRLVRGSWGLENIIKKERVEKMERSRGRR